jgi:hypothetical protein
MNFKLFITMSVCMAANMTAYAYYEGYLSGRGGAGYPSENYQVEQVCASADEQVAVFKYNEAHFEFSDRYSYAWSKLDVSASILNETHVVFDSSSGHLYNKVARNGECVRVYCEAYIPNFFYYDVAAVWNVSSVSIA